jgi:hypothetical protein
MMAGLRVEAEVIEPILFRAKTAMTGRSPTEG